MVCKDEIAGGLSERSRKQKPLLQKSRTWGVWPTFSPWREVEIIESFRRLPHQLRGAPFSPTDWRKQATNDSARSGGPLSVMERNKWLSRVEGLTYSLAQHLLSPHDQGLWVPGVVF
ncbi:hypothetical protein CSIM01_06906 [Colletotrichum simmondsii]|uniref:Uncharacterized protein n=1 Tax=Colletotrichum simmondsii TaxID=703756 RepID=A0A135SXS1_9PEZI|nr:hypothetical protein CSIM01_06906 [Colletotrichum simmondsii]